MKSKWRMLFKFKISEHINFCSFLPAFSFQSFLSPVSCFSMSSYTSCDHHKAAYSLQLTFGKCQKNTRCFSYLVKNSLNMRDKVFYIAEKAFFHLLTVPLKETNLPCYFLVLMFSAASPDTSWKCYTVIRPPTLVTKSWAASVLINRRSNFTQACAYVQHHLQNTTIVLIR